MALDHINLVVKNLKVCRHFYETVLGMQVTFEKHLSGPWFEEVTGIRGAEAHCLFLEFPDGGCRLELLQYTPSSEESSPPPPPSCPGFRHMALEVQDLAALQSRLAEAGCPVISEPVSVPFAVGAAEKQKCLFYFRDPEGNLLEAAAYL